MVLEFVPIPCFCSYVYNSELNQRSFTIWLQPSSLFHFLPPCQCTTYTGQLNFPLIPSMPPFLVCASYIPLCLSPQLPLSTSSAPFPLLIVKGPFILQDLVQVHKYLALKTILSFYCSTHHYIFIYLFI